LTSPAWCPLPCGIERPLLVPTISARRSPRQTADGDFTAVSIGSGRFHSPATELSA
jgi:hypothetical protein